MTKDNKNKNIQKLVDSYSSMQSNYSNFSESMKTVLEKLLDAKGARHQLVTARVKDIESFETKIRSITPQIKDITEVKDLAGCRIIFYLDSEAVKFIETIHQEFEVIDAKSIVSINSYNAYHMTVKLKSPRVDLTEYEQFKDLKCEIQLTTVLFHAWSELNHDLVYKDKQSLEEFDPEGFKALKSELELIMEDHIKVASRKFEVVSRKADKLREGKQVFDTEFLNKLPTLESNNEIYDNLRLLEQYINEFPEDKTPADIDIIDLLLAVIAQSKKK